MSSSYDAKTTNPASINTPQQSQSQPQSQQPPRRRHQHQHHHQHHPSHTTQPIQQPVARSAASTYDITDINERSTWKDWLIGFTAAIAIPVWYGFKTGAGTHLATWLFTRYGIIGGGHGGRSAPPQHVVSYHYYLDGKTTTAEPYKITTPAVVATSQPSTYASTYSLPYPAIEPLVIPLSQYSM